MDHSHLLSDATKNTKVSYVLRFVQEVRPPPNAIRLTGGLPNPATYPFKKLTITMRDRQEITIEGPLMEKCLQYGTHKGFPPLREHLLNLTKRMHDPPIWENLDIAILPGCNSGLAYAFDLLLDPGDTLILTDPCYPGVFTTSKGRQPRVMTVKCDWDGVIPDDLRQMLEKCKRDGARKPKVLCVNPSGNNPVGCVWSEARRRLVYDIACEYDFVIVEDDPYFFLEFSEELTPSFLSLDTEGRVIRLDSFSKTVGAGLRLGYATGHKVFIDHMQQLVRNSIDHPATIVQASVSQMLDCIGLDGYLENLKKTKQFYKERRDIMVQAAEKHLKGLCEWNVPDGSFFLWIKVVNVPDTTKLLLDRGIQKGLMFMPGEGFFYSGEKSQYIRVSYTLIKDANESCRLLAEAIREEIMENEQTKLKD